MNKTKIIDMKFLGRLKHTIILNTCDYLKENPTIKSLILGISGGIDSAIVSVLAKEAVLMMKRDYYGNRDIKLIGRSYPMTSNTDEELKRSTALGELICNDFDVMTLQGSYTELLHSMTQNKLFDYNRIDSMSELVRKGNIKARIRMIYLYDLAQANNGLVLSTDNYSEYLLGFWTLHGDVGDFGMIQNLWKTEVYMLANFCYRQCQYSELKQLAKALKACIDAVPTDGLGITKSDFDQFGDVKSYQEIDQILIKMLNSGYGSFIFDGEVPEVLKRYERTKFKRENPFNISRETLTEGT